jgi:hypothetical protein
VVNQLIIMINFQPFWCVVCIGLLLSGRQAANAGGVVSNATEAEFRAALQGGGLVTFATNATIPLTGTVLIDKDTTIDGTGRAVIISGGNNVRLFQVASNVSFWIQSLTLADGKIVGTNGADGDPPTPGENGNGAAILNNGGSVTVVDCLLTNHFAQGGTGGSNTSWLKLAGSIGGIGRGAAICSLGGSVNLTNSTLVNNFVTGGHGHDLIDPSADGEGGAIYGEGCRMTLQGATLDGNNAVGGFPQLLSQSNNSQGGAGSGGAIFASNCNLSIINSQLNDNTATGPVLNPAQTRGGGAAPGIGGAVFLTGDSSALIQASVLSSNTASGGSDDVGGFAWGGAIFNSGSLQMIDDALGNNSVVAGTSGGPAQGGAICSINTLN